MQIRIIPTNTQVNAGFVCFGHGKNGLKPWPPPWQVITDPISSRSKGYGFVRFGNEGERDRALSEMAGHIISNRPVRVSIATAKKSAPAVHGGGGGGGGGAPGVAVTSLLGDMDPSNTTLFIGGLNAAVRL